ncbi:hypothetical protein F4780DRAFT_222801 [Xylariomycetidae sp. FL0641]|nr:hypothetical protein F4780DRAFT_222801 [Xylariomycetidae sp. FL0641]
MDPPQQASDDTSSWPTVLLMVNSRLQEISKSRQSRAQAIIPPHIKAWHLTGRRSRGLAHLIFACFLFLLSREHSPAECALETVCTSSTTDPMKRSCSWLPEPRGAMCSSQVSSESLIRPPGCTCSYVRTTCNQSSAAVVRHTALDCDRRVSTCQYGKTRLRRRLLPTYLNFVSIQRRLRHIPLRHSLVW